MPWTFAHPAAALLFNRVAKNQCEFAALVMGTISPDIGYYLGSTGLNLRTHSLIGSLKLCLPMALALLAILMLLRHPLWLLLPTPHRQALLPLRDSRIQIGIKSALRICLWILLGAWTHIAWDACTHRTGLLVQQVAILQSVWLFGWPGYQFAQHFSSALGVFVLGVAYLRWQRSKSRLCDADDGFERWRWRLIVGSAAAAILLGLLHALTLANAAPIALFWRVLMFQFAIRTTSTFAILTVLCAMVLFWRIKRAHFGRPPGPKSSI